QVDQVHRRDRLRRGDAAHRLEPGAAVGVRLLLQRESRRGPPALEPGHRTPDQRHHQPAVRRPDPDEAVQRICAAGGAPVPGDGPADVALSRVALAKVAVHAAALAPLAHLSWQVADVVRNGSHVLGAEPVVEIEHRLGTWALRLLLATLAVTPLRQWTGQPVLLRFRRMLGLYAFTYATLHLAAYLVLDLRWAWALALEDIASRPYITV